MFDRKYLIAVPEHGLRVLNEKLLDLKVREINAIESADRALEEKNNFENERFTSLASRYRAEHEGLVSTCSLFGIELTERRGTGIKEIDFSKLHEQKDMFTVMRENWNN